jgi:hypothetical protein
MISAFAVTWAYSNWPKRKVQDAVGKMIKDAQTEVDRAELRGDKIVVGKGTFEINDDVDVTYTIGTGGVGYMLDASVAASGKAAEK